MALLTGTRNWNLVLFAFVALLLASTGVGAPESAGNGTVEEKDFKPLGAIKMEFDLARGSYPGFQRQLHQVLKTSRTVDGIPVLVAQTFPALPPTFILITVTSGNAKVTLAVRNDNVYIVGFGNAAGWFAFPRFLHQITGSTKLPVTEDYGDLIDGHVNLEGLDVSKEAVVQALTFLSTYKAVKDKAHKDTLGISLTRLIVVVSEAARFKTFYNTVEQGLKEDHALLTKQQATLVVLWRDISEQLLSGSWKTDDKLKQAGINTKQDAIDALNVLLWPKGVKLAGNATSVTSAN